MKRVNKRIVVVSQFAEDPGVPSIPQRLVANYHGPRNSAFITINLSSLKHDLHDSSFSQIEQVYIRINGRIEYPSFPFFFFYETTFSTPGGKI